MPIYAFDVFVREDDSDNDWVFLHTAYAVSEAEAIAQVRLLFPDYTSVDEVYAEKTRQVR